jgi:hypothetical protein
MFDLYALALAHDERDGAMGAGHGGGGGHDLIPSKWYFDGPPEDAHGEGPGGVG